MHTTTENAEDAAITGNADPLLEESGTPRSAIQDLGSRIIGYAGRLASATCRWLLMVAEFDDRDGAAAYGLPTTSAWLAMHCGIADRTARDHVRVARALAQFPTLAASMQAGRISYSHARAIAGVARSGEDGLVGDLLVAAEYGTIHQLESLIAGLRITDRHLADPIDPPRPIREVMSFRDRSDCRIGFSGHLSADRAQILRAALDAVIAADDADRLGVASTTDSRGSTEPEEPAMNQCEALVRMAELTLALLAERGQDLPTRREDDDTTLVLHLHAVPDRTDPSTPIDHDRSGSAEPPGWQLVHEVAITAAHLRVEHDLPAPGGSTDASEHDRNGSAEPSPARPLISLAGYRGGPAAAAGLPGRVAEHLACSCRIRVVNHGDTGTVLDLGHTRRLASDKQVRALLERDGNRCAHPGCRRRHRLHAHHVVFWQDLGPTDLDNLIMLCDYHHHAVHRGAVTIRAWGAGRFTFSCHGRTLPTYADPTRHIDTPWPLEDEHDHVAPDAAANRWDGSRLESEFAVSVLATARYRDRDTRRAARPDASTTQAA